MDKTGDIYVAKRVTIEDAMDCLWRAYQQLPECSRQARLLHDIGGIEEEETAIQLGVDICAIERDITAALNRLQRALAPKVRPKVALTTIPGGRPC